MNKIVFLEDRPYRLNKLLPNGDKDFKKLINFSFLYMPSGDECRTIIANINNKNYQFEDSIKIIIVHRSSLTTNGFNFLSGLCKQKQISLICFSGKISQLTYDNDNYELLNINIAEFYTDRLILFFENFSKNVNPHILEIAYINWILSYLFLSRQLLHTLELEEKAENKDLDRINILKRKYSQAEKILKSKNISIENNAERISCEIKKLLLEL